MSRFSKGSWSNLNNVMSIQRKTASFTDGVEMINLNSVLILLTQSQILIKLLYRKDSNI